MSWKWEELTAGAFTEATQACGGVCVVPLGVLEKHGEHLPLGTDGLNVMALAERAVAQEPAVIFPTYYWGQIHEARCWPGTVALRHDLLLALLENVCEEIARNGLKKIVLLNGHGGNDAMLSLFAFRMLERPRDFSLYIIKLEHYLRPVLAGDAWKARMESDFEEHAGEAETSVMLAHRPDLVRMEAIGAPGAPQGRLGGLNATTPIWWSADFPTHYAGDATSATPEKGAFLLERYTECVANILASVKDDTQVARLQEEFFASMQH